MSQEDIIVIGDRLRQMPTALKDIPKADLDVLMNALEPAPTFTDEQRHYLFWWWLELDAVTLAKINQAANLQLVARPLNGKLYISSTILTDAVNGGPLANIIPLIDDLVFTFIETWPEPDSLKYA